MKSKQVKLLQNQIDKLTSDSFDLEAWKSATEACLIRVFGDTDSRIQQIRDLKIDYGSWALRDAQGDYNPLKTCKKKGEEILLSAVDEIEILGIPISTEAPSSDVVSCFEKELKVAEMKDLVIDEVVAAYAPQAAARLLAFMVTLDRMSPLLGRAANK